MNDTSLNLTPEQVAAIDAGHGIVRAQDPASARKFLLLEDRPQPRLTEDELRAMIAEGIAEADRGECRPWNVDELKEELRERFAKRNG